MSLPVTARSSARPLKPASLLLLLNLLLPGVVAGAEEDFEDVPHYTVSALLPAQLKQSPYHSVEQVEVDGRFFHYRVDSEFGPYEAGSTAMLRARVEETAILSQAVNQFARQDGNMGEELRGQLSISADNALDILVRPVETATDLAGQVADNFSDTLAGESGFRTATPSDYRVEDPSDPAFAAHRRNVAAQWGLDIYSSNPRVQEFLDSVARARSAGRISAGAPSFINTGFKPPPGADATIDAVVANGLKTHTARELLDTDSRVLGSIQIPPEVVRRFIEHPAYSPRHKSRIAHYLAALDGVRNRAAFLEAAVVADDEDTALAFEQAAIMLLWYQRNVARLEKIHSGGNVLQAVSSEKALVHFLPVDIIYWSEHTAELFDALESGARRAGYESREVMTSATLTPRASMQLELRNFTVRHMGD